MLSLKKSFKIFAAFLVVAAFFLFFPNSHLERPKDGALATLPGYVDEDSMENSVLNDSYSNSCGCNKEIVLGEHDSDEDLDKNWGQSDSKDVENNICVIERETETPDFKVYAQDGKVYLVIKKTPNEQNVWAAYEFIRDQGCILSDGNLEWVY